MVQDNRVTRDHRHPEICGPTGLSITTSAGQDRFRLHETVVQKAVREVAQENRNRQSCLALKLLQPPPATRPRMRGDTLILGYPRRLTPDWNLTETQRAQRSEEDVDGRQRADGKEQTGCSMYDMHEIRSPRMRGDTLILGYPRRLTPDWNLTETQRAQRSEEDVDGRQRADGKEQTGCSMYDMHEI